MKKILFLVIFLCLFLVSGCSVKETDALKFKKEYESLNGVKTDDGKHKYRKVNISKDNPMVYSTCKEINKLIDDKESFVVYFGFSKCPWCRSVVESLVEAGNKSSLGKIYYVDIEKIRDVKKLVNIDEVSSLKEGDPDYMKLLDKLGDVLEDYKLEADDGREIDTGEKRIYAPNVVAVIDGKAYKMSEGISKDLKDPYSKLTDKMKKYSYNQFKCLLKCVNESKNVCTKKDVC